MENLFPIVEVPDDAPEKFEDMGTKPKFWYRDTQGKYCLYKEVRVGTGEDWSEKIACELCKLLELPHVHYELATWKGTKGVVSQHFCEKDRLVHGNLLLASFIPEYPNQQRYHVKQHTIVEVTSAISNPRIKPPSEYSLPQEFTAIDVFVGYLLLDAWIGNTDRHHENWAVILDSADFTLAPTHDHASCLGRELTDNIRVKRLNTKDTGYSVKKYIEKCESAFYDDVNAKKPLTCLDAFELTALVHVSAGKYWLDSLSRIPLEQVHVIFERIPSGRISEESIEFAMAILEINQNRLLELPCSKLWIQKKPYF